MSRNSIENAICAAATNVGSLVAIAMFFFTASSVPAKADFIQSYYLYPDTSTVLYDLGVQATPFSISFEGAGNLSLSSSGNIVTLTDELLGNTHFLTASFNGPELIDLTNSDILNVLFDPSSTIAGFDQSRISFTSNTIMLNVEGLPVDVGQSAVVDVASNLRVPEPSTLAVFDFGLLFLIGLGMTRRRLAKEIQ